MRRQMNSVIQTLVVALSVPAALWAQHHSTEFKVQLIVERAGAPAASAREEFSKQTKPGAGKELRILMLASRDCQASVAAFTRDGQLVYGVPEIVALQSHVVKELPSSNKWKFDASEQLAEMDVVVGDPAAPDFKTYSDLVSKMNHPGLASDVRDAQAGAVREWIDSQLESKTTAQDYTVKENPQQLGGLMRGADLPGQPIMVPPLRISVIRIRIQ